MTIKPSIAVVDDDESVREATTRLLRSLGFIAKGFSSPDEFLSSNRQHITSCLIADVQMPGKSGLALYGQLIASGNPDFKARWGGRSMSALVCQLNWSMQHRH